MAAQLGVSTETIRKDMVVLERAGLLRRVHGGAVPIGRLSYEPAVANRNESREEKLRIAKAALEHVPALGSVLIDAGSTTASLVELFPVDRELTVYTNTLTAALALLDRPNLTVISLGGRIRKVTAAEVGEWTARALREVNVDVAFLGANGVSALRGLTTPDPAEAGVKRLMLQAAVRRVLLADSTKLGAVSMCQFGDLQDIDLMITDSGVSESQLEELRAAGLTVQVA
jgi:DeoR family fructose operon transcriptional repressor